MEKYITPSPNVPNYSKSEVMSQQMRLFATFSHTVFGEQEKHILLTNPAQGALLAVRAVDDLFGHLKRYLSLSADIARLRETTPDPKNDMLHWLHFIQRHPYIREIRLDDEAIYLYQKAEFLLTVVHLVVWNDCQNARFMFGEA